MTNEDAANILRLMASGIELKNHTEHWISSFEKAYEMAIKVLEERPQGEWITFPTNHSIIQCPECTALLNNLRVDVFKDKIGKMNYCPNCGADMRGKDNGKL